MEDMIQMLKHDLHKIKISGYLSHAESLKDELMREADAIAARLGRNGNQFVIEESHPFRIKYLSNGKDVMKRDERRKIQQDLKQLFEESKATKLHSVILKTKKLNLFAEAQKHPYSSLKYHLVLSCALYYNLKQGKNWFELNLCENPKERSEFQVIYRDDRREWALLPEFGMSRVRSKFYETWDRRTENSIGGEDQVLEHLLSQIGSWSSALALIEEWNMK